MRAPGALAESEEEWTPEDDQEFVEMVSAEEVHARVFSLGGGIYRQTAPHSRYPIWRIEAAGLRLHLEPPLLVEVEDDDDEVIVSSPAVRIWGIGADKYRALEDFHKTFVRVLTSYEETPPDQLTDDAKQYLSQLHAMIRRREAV